MDKLSFVSNTGPAVVDDLYSQYKLDPETVDFGWRKFFEGFDLAGTTFQIKKHGGLPVGANLNTQAQLKEIAVLNLIHAYRTRGHLFTKTNPIRERRSFYPNLDI